MKINHITEKGSGEMNEDNIVITKNIFGVFDGATSVYKYRDETGRTGGFIASSIAKKVFEKGNNSLQELVLEASSELKKEMISKSIDLKETSKLWCTSAAVIKIHKDTFDWIQISDSLILVIYEDNSYELLDDDYDHDEKLLILYKELADQKKKDIYGLLRNKIRETRGGMNISYGVINGDDKVMNFIKKGNKELKSVKHILIFTDGLFIPKKDPRAKEDFDTFVKLFLEGGLVKIKDYVRSIEKEDPNCWEFPRFKQYDDIAAISISFP